MKVSKASLGPAHFQRLYTANPDPWQLRTSEYERAKYRRSIASLGSRHFRSGFEAGCSVGALTRLLAKRCDALLAVDILEAPLVSARRACADRPWVRFERMRLPRVWPDERFDLIVLSEVLYFLSRRDIVAVANRVRATLEPNGLVLMVNWRGCSSDPCTGDEAAGIFMDHTNQWLTPSERHREDAYRLDVLCHRQAHVFRSSL